MIVSILLQEREKHLDFLKRIERNYPNVIAQIVNAKLIDNGKVIDMIAEQTLYAMKSGGLLAEKPSFDLLLRLTGTTQINEAIKIASLNDGEEAILILIGEEREVIELLNKERIIGKPLQSRELSEYDLERIEGAALLIASRS